MLHALNKSRAELARDDAHARATAVTASVGGRAICVTLAEHVPYVVHLGDAAKVEVFQRDLQRQRNIRGASFLILSSTTESKHGKYVERVLLTATVSLMLLEPLLPMLVVNFPLLRVTENVICIGDLFHPLLGLLVAGVLIGMELQAEFAIGSFDLLLCCALGQA